MNIYRSEEGKAAVIDRYREVLELWPVDNEHLRIPTRHGETFVIASGPKDAPPLLLCHGSGANSVSWMGDVARWSESYRVFAVDMIGEPGLSDPNRPDWHSEAYVDWLDDLLEHLGIRHFSLIGMSLGGWLGLTYAVARPESVDALALICPGGLAPARLSFLFKVMFYMPFGAWGRQRIMALIGQDNGENSDAETTSIPDEMLEFMALIWKHFNHRKGNLPILSDESLRRLNMPVKMFFGNQDALLNSPASVRRLADAVPHTEIEVLEGTGHVILRKTEQILDFLDRCPHRQGSRQQTDPVR